MTARVTLASTLADDAETMVVTRVVVGYQPDAVRVGQLRRQMGRHAWFRLERAASEYAQINPGRPVLIGSELAWLDEHWARVASVHGPSWNPQTWHVVRGVLDAPTSHDAGTAVVELW